MCEKFWTLSNEILPDYVPCYFPGEYRRKKFRVDGYAYDEFDKTMNLITADYTGLDDGRKMTLTIANQAITRAMVLVEAALKSNLCNTVDISTSPSDLVDILRSNNKNIRRFRVFVFTDASMSDRIKNVEVRNFEGIPVEAQIWDINRLFEVCTAPGNESIEIKFSDYGIEGIPCLEADVGDEQKYKSYLGVISGEILAKVYDKYGARLLEGNVRSFLSTKVSVNKKIRETILNSPDMFFAFNNGISVTAEDVRVYRGWSIKTKINEAINYF